MAIVYCCWTTGNDTTGDGSYGTPYKTITKADDGLTGGDEVRVSKSAAHTALTGTLTWADNSVTVTTSADLTGELSAGDMIGKDADDNMWWEVASLNSTTITLRGVYGGTSETVASYKMGFHDCGSPGSTENLQTIGVSGTSVSSRLKVSGGWDLSTQTQDGKSFFCVTHSTNRYGYGLYAGSRNFLDVSNLFFARFRGGVHCTTIDGNSFKDVGCFSNGAGDNLAIYVTTNSVFENIWANTQQTSSSYDAINTTGRGNTWKNISVASAGEGLFVESGGNVFKGVTARCCAAEGISTVGGNWFDDVLTERNLRGITRAAEGTNVIRVGKWTSNNDTTVIYGDTIPATMVIGQLIASGYTNLFSDVTTGNRYVPFPAVSIQRLGNDANSGYMYYYHGKVEQDATDARSGAGSCLKATPTSAADALWVSLGKYRVVSVAADIVLSVYAKDDATFDGTVELMATMNGQIISDFWVEKTMDTTYGQHSLTVDTTDLVNGEWLELVARVTGTAGSVFFDDFAATAV